MKNKHIRKSLYIVLILSLVIFYQTPAKMSVFVIAANYEEYHYLRIIGASDAWKFTNGSSDVTVAVIDSGIDFSHQELIGSEWINIDEIANNSIDDDLNGYVDDVVGWDFVSNDSVPGPESGDPIHWHATFIAGIISGEIDGEGVAGIASNVSIMDVRVLKSDNYAGTTYEGFGDAIRYAADNGADVISMSLQYYGDHPDYYDDIVYAVSQNVSVVSITGNTDVADGGGKYYSSYPGAYDEVISVGASDFSGNKADYSNYGPWTDIVAPVGDEGVGIFGTAPVDDYYRGWGTSFAAPQVAAAIALIKSYNDTITPAQIRTLLQETATDLGDPGIDDDFGYGQLNLTSAFNTMLGIKPTTNTADMNLIPLITTFIGITTLVIIFRKRKK